MIALSWAMALLRARRCDCDRLSAGKSRRVQMIILGGVTILMVIGMIAHFCGHAHA
jgi:hypothetical protein